MSSTEYIPLVLKLIFVFVKLFQIINNEGQIFFKELKAVLFKNLLKKCLFKMYFVIVSMYVCEQ